LPINKKRSRIVSFRLSQEEYDSLKSVSATRGARSVSDFTRSVAFQTNDRGNGGMDMIEETLRLLKDKMDTIDLEIKKLSKAYDEKEIQAAGYGGIKEKEPNS
jgi:hypothetical protein